MSNIGHSLRVTGDTSVHQLQDLASKVGDNSKLRGKRMDDGSILLYTKTGGSSLMSRLSGKAAERRGAAHDAIGMVLQKQDGDAAKVGLAKNDKLRVGLGCLYHTNGMTGTHSMRGTEFKTIAGAMTEMNKLIGSKDKETHFADGKRLGDLNKPGVDNLVTMMSKLVGQPGDLDGLAGPLAKGLAVLVDADLTDEDKLKFALSPGVGFKEDLKASLLDELSKTKSPDFIATLKDSKEMGEFVDKVYNKIASDLLPNKAQPDGSIKIGNDVYTKTSHIAKGGFGSVDLYECGNKQIAVKVSIQKDPEVMGEFSKEYFAHRTAVGGETPIGSPQTNPNVVALHGAFRTETGDIGVIMEYVPNKSLHETMENIQSALQRGDNTKQQALDLAMTAVKDVASGLDHMEKAKTDPNAEEGQSVHGDLKPPNVFVQTGGVAKIGDFGTTQSGGTYVPTRSSEVANPRWLSPEVIVLKDKARDLGKNDTFLPDPEKNNLEGIRTNLTTAFEGKNIAKKDMDKLFNAVSTPVRDEAIDQLGTTATSDVWALGVIGFNLVFGRNPSESNFSSDIEGELLAFSQNPFNQAITTVGDNDQVLMGSFAAYSSGNTEVDEFLNLLLSPNPQDRPSPEDILQHPVLNTPNIGSQSTRNLFDAIQSGDSGQIRLASGVGGNG